uniref:Signal recognition particle SRP54 subunit M-domain domain-containing protein n=1 Tax=Chrysotila carterae TaxID=13221 RepID=A0A7S4B2W5_CHRCT|mmetsp:Transcript_21734/g.42337  ORF Transcript_21734/g.42337 Transcript_21734/m.42337 type:complete len:258 (-) Transcript_21734:352-1125(-)
MAKTGTVAIFLAAAAPSVECWQLGTAFQCPSVLSVRGISTNGIRNAGVPGPSMGLINENSLAGKMFGTIADSVKDLAKAAGIGQETENAASPTKGKAASDIEGVVADLDMRAQSGELTFKDFITMSEAFLQMDGKMPGMPGKLTESQIAETRSKFEKHKKIVDVMLDEEKADPVLLIEDLKAGGATPGPRIQRLAKASGQPETEVALFLMQFEGMRESTRRIAAGEDPDQVTESMGAAPPGSNRAARRAAKKKKSKK